jgi:deoxyribonuclease-4
VVVHAGSAAGWEARGMAADAGSVADRGARGGAAAAGSGQSARQRALAQLSETVAPLLDKLSDDDPDLLFEPMAGQGQMLCARAEDLAEYLAAVQNHPRAGICLDTCHLFAAGHDLTAADGLKQLLDELAALDGGMSRVKLVHANDSVLGCGSRRDRHEAVGAGHIGAEPFRALLAALPGVPFVVETPGGKAGHARDIATLKELRGR